jgi:hypothetical protein
MRDPDLVVRAQQAATALESAWRHWRNLHGLDADPLPPVSSYVGYSLDAPWGETRVVLGICAEEAELLASLLEGHDCVGPVHASVTAKPVGRTQSAGLADALGQPGAAGLVHVPAPAPASAGQQTLPAGSSLSRHDPLSGPRRRDPAGSSELTRPSAGGSPSLETPIALAASRAVEASIASRKKAANGSAANGAAANGSANGSAANGAAANGSANGSAANGSAANGAAANGSANGSAGNGSGAPRSEQAGVPAATSGPDGPRNGDRVGPGQRPALDLGRESPRPIESQPAGSADDATAVGGLPAIPAIQPFPWAASQLQSDADRRPASEHVPAGEHRSAGERADDGAGPGGPEIVAFRPRPEALSPPGAQPGSPAGPRQQAESFPAQRDAAPTQQIESELARSSRVMRGPSWSALKRQGQNADRPQPPAADQSPAPEATESAGWPQDSRDHLSSAAASADAATWAAGELPGQAAVTDTAV